MNYEQVRGRNEYKDFCHFLENESGISLGDNKEYLVSSRLATLLKKYDEPNLGALLERIQSTQEFKLRALVVDAMTTNETSWFRDKNPFDLIVKDICPKIIDSGSKQIDIWSAACSTGQEPYSILMSLEQWLGRRLNMPGSAVNINIIATDLSTRVLEQARDGRYNQLAINRGMPGHFLKRYFKDDGEDNYQICKEARSAVRFVQNHLLQDKPPGKFDIIFCRNVLIYFSDENKRMIVDKLWKALKPNGSLILGGSESLPKSDKFDLVRHPLGLSYRRKG